MSQWNLSVRLTGQGSNLSSMLRSTAGDARTASRDVNTLRRDISRLRTEASRPSACAWQWTAPTCGATCSARYPVRADKPSPSRSA
ncbi:hypothetical protein ACFQ0X_43590 [Streptomyces rectiviolaceus]|uniref:hypothetical protein n=1 Tax=Streptomyces rectiviolaceus TaxID=332591 RepID=UPI003640DAC0